MTFRGEIFSFTKIQDLFKSYLSISGAYTYMFDIFRICLKIVVSGEAAN